MSDSPIRVGADGKITVVGLVIGSIGQTPPAAPPAAPAPKTPAENWPAPVTTVMESGVTVTQYRSLGNPLSGLKELAEYKLAALAGSDGGTAASAAQDVDLFNMARHFNQSTDLPIEGVLPTFFDQELVPELLGLPNARAFWQVLTLVFKIQSMRYLLGQSDKLAMVEKGTLEKAIAELAKTG